ncbi:ChaN family lipoprotein [Zobellella iuensis]|uniref:ChaN family lipoprotein n=1 Tax=Zobellella iuensis TaxID=2803811 RepID=A0ABS1QRQ2_9GAMM|nr:ChaN family lipoprotein [Zobellella iuensis]MBL1377548.1 ChaN family lipoprotein [Zobellella iuensis]
MRVLMLLTLLLLGGCQAEASPPATPFDYQLHDPAGAPLNLSQAAKQLASADVIMVGELHGHQGIHRFQADLLARLLAQPRPLALAMEQFSRDRQPVLDAYLEGKLGEDAFIEQARAWPGYRSDYRPLVELARHAGIDVLAANAPRHIVRCIGREGPGYLDRLPASHRAWVAERLTLTDDGYKARFMASRHHGQPPTEFQFAAQTSWDDTMAESIAHYLQAHPGYRVMLTVGRFHIGDGLGTAQRLQQRAPRLRLALLYPVTPGEAEPAPPLWRLRVAEPPAARPTGEPAPALAAGEPEC